MSALASTKAVRWTTFLTGLAALCAPTAGANTTFPLEIPAQDLFEAIEELSAQTNTQIAVNKSLLDRRRSPSVSGAMTAQAALEQILDDPMLNVVKLYDGSLVVLSKDQPAFVSQAEMPFDLGILRLEKSDLDRRAGLTSGILSTPDQFETKESTSVLIADELEESPEIQSVEDAVRRLPNINTLGTSNGFIQIRGEDAEGPGNSSFGLIPGALSPTPVTINGRELSFGELTFGITSVYDTGYLEVVRGPQTTSGGVNGAVGAINIVTKDPTFEFSYGGQIEARSFDGYQIAGYVSGPIAPDVALRFSVDSNQRDAFINFEDGVNEAVRTLEQNTARATLLWTPSEAPNFRLRSTLSYSEFSGPQTEIVNDIPNITDTRGDPPAFAGDTEDFTTIATYDFSSTLRLTNTFTAARYTLNRINNSGSFFFDQEGKEYSNEIKLDYTSNDGRLRGTSGLYYRVQTENNFWDFRGASDFDGRRESLGLFTQLNYDLTDRLEVFGGLRYQSESQERTGFLFTDSNPVPEIGFDNDDDAFLPKAGLNYKVNDTTEVGAVVSRGFSPGGFSFAFPLAPLFGDRVTPASLPPFEAETRTVYEVFLRHQSPDNRLQLGANLFYNDISDPTLEARTTLPNGEDQSVIINGDQAKLYGLEVSADYQATERLRVFGALGVLRSELTRFDASPEVEGNELREAPKYTLSLGFDWSVTQRFSFGGDVSFVDGYFSDFTNDPINAVPSRTLVTLNTSYDLTDGVELYGYVDNVFDQSSPQFLFSAGSRGVLTKPREIGIGLRATF